MRAIGFALLKTLVPRLDARQGHAIYLEREIAIKLRAGGNVSHREMVAGDEGAAFEMRVEKPEQDCGAGETLADRLPVPLVFRRAIEIPEHAAGEGGLQVGERPVHPHVALRADTRIVGRERACAVLRGEIAHDRMALPHDGSV